MATTDELHAVDVRRWQRWGYLSRPSAFRSTWTQGGEVVGVIGVITQGSTVTLIFRSCGDKDDDWVDRRQVVEVERTPCYFGGDRAWFLCPMRWCQRRVAKLYLGGSGVFACRQCHRLTYECQNERAGHRAMRRAVKIRRRLGDPDGYTLEYLDRPKGMHRRTYERLLDEHDRAERLSW